MTLNTPPNPGRLNGGKPSGIAVPIIVCLGASLLMSTAAYSQQPQIAPRGFAAQNPYDVDPREESIGQPVWEMWLAVGSAKIISVFHNEYLFQNQQGQVGERKTIGYAVYDREAENWTGTGVIPFGEVYGFEDPCIAADPLSGNFAVCARGNYFPPPPPPANVCPFVVVALYDAAVGSWGPWFAIAESSTNPFDKTWIVAGEMSEQRREYYVFFARTAGAFKGYGYRRTIDGGKVWLGDDVKVDGQAVHGMPVAIQPSVLDNDTMFLVYTSQEGVLSSEDPDERRSNFQILKATDIDSGPDAGKLNFEYVVNPDGSPLVIALNHTGMPDDAPDIVPGGLALRTVPWIAADPTDSSRLFVVYHDTRAPVWEQSDDAKDLDIYVQVIENTAQRWQAGQKVRVNDDSTPFRSDQFLPSITIDSAGRLHIIWYDDREYNRTSDQLDGDDPSTGTPDPKFDVYYARGEIDPSGQLVFPGDDQPLYGAGVEATEPALSYVRLHAPNPDWDFPDRPGEYNGIAMDGDRVWTSFTGTSAEDAGIQGHNPSVIWSSLIDWNP